MGAAIGPDSLTLVEVRRVRGRSVPGASVTERVGPPADDGSWPEVADALRRFQEALSAAEAVLSLAVLRPFASVKRLHLPPLSGADLQAAVERGADQLFPVERGSVLAGAVRARDRTRSPEGVPVLATIASARVVSAVVHAAENAGYRVDGVCVGPVAAACGAMAISSGLRRGRTALVLPFPDFVEVLCLEGGDLHVVRFAPRGWEALLQDSAEASGYVPDRLCGVGDAAAVVASPGEEVVVEPALADMTAAELSAFGAALLPVGAPVLVTEADRGRIRLRQRRRTLVLSAMAAFFLIVTGSLHLRGLREDMRVVQERRMQLRPAVAQALRLRGEITAVREQVEALEKLDTGRSRWTVLFAALTDVLPRDAHLTSLRLGGHELRLDGRARSAAALVPMFEALSWTGSVRLGSPVQRERTPGGVVEGFSLTVEVSDVEGLARNLLRGAAADIREGEPGGERFSVPRSAR